MNLSKDLSVDKKLFSTTYVIENTEKNCSFSGRFIAIFGNVCE